MEIVNEIKSKNGEEKKKFEHRSLADVQRLKLEKLMKNPDKPVIIPETTKKERDYVAPSFVRNVMGSSAGAGSGEFHVYRHLRRKEYARQKYMKIQTERERLDQEFQDRIDANQKKADDKTLKNRAKRQKKKESARNKNKKPKIEEKPESEDEESSENDEEKSEKSDIEETPKDDEEKTPENVVD